MTQQFKQGLLELLRTAVISLAVALVGYFLNNLGHLNLSPEWILILTPILKGLDEWLGELKVGVNNYGITGF